MNLEVLLLDSWRRQCGILDSLFDLVTPDLAQAKPSEDGMAIIEQFCHIGNTRRFWLTKALGAPLDPAGRFYKQVGEDWVPLDDLSDIRSKLRTSGDVVAETVQRAIQGEIALEQYENPVLLLQHMVWHEGYHFSLIMLALRLAGHEPKEEWEDAHVWQPWRGIES